MSAVTQTVKNTHSQARGARSARLRKFLTHSQPLSDEAWAGRHRFILWLVGGHVPAIFVFALVRHYSLAHSALEAGGLAVLWALAAWPGSSRLVHEGFGTFALMTCSALVVHVSGGSIEAHFHFFVMLAVVALYQSWFPFLLGIVYVVIHHGLLGTIHPIEVYNNPAAVRSPWLWAGIHAFFVSMAAAVYVVQWRLNEGVRNEARGLYQKLYEGQLSVVQQLQEAATMKDELVSIVSHELRTPLTSVIGYLQLVRDTAGLSDVEMQECLTRASRQAERLEFLVENLLNYQKVEVADSDTVDIGTVVHDVVAEQSEYPGAERLKIAEDIAHGLRARASEHAIRLITANLVNNAVKFAPAESTIVVRTALEGNNVTLSVSNEGPEIARGDRDRIFGAFVQLDSSTTRRVPGVGLGLHIVRRTVDAYHGEVDVDSHDGRVIFTVRLPRASDARAA